MATPAPAHREENRRERFGAFAENSRATAEALTGLWALALTVSIFAMLYFGREVFVPLALSALFAFMLEPLINWLARWIGRTSAAVLVLIVVLAALVELGVVLSRQLNDLANQLPAYRGNLSAKIRDIVPANNGLLAKLTHLSEDLQKTAEQAAPPKPASTSDKTPLDVRVVRTGASTPLEALQAYVEPLMGPLGTAFLVILLVVFMAIKADDLQERFIRLVGHGRIGATAYAIDDATSRIRRYLGMQLLTNLIYGIALAVGLHFIGVPNALLWGGLAAALRFIPYVGPWIAVIPPLLLSLAVSPSWMGPLLTLGLFLALELVTGNVLEPWLYGASTGVSSFALVVAAVFWTTIWGPIGLLLSTPLTVCLVVMGRHIPSLSFLNVMLGEEEALSPSEQMYRRLLRPHSFARGREMAEDFVAAHSLVEFYDQVLLPVVRASESDRVEQRLTAEQRKTLVRSLRALVDEIDADDDYGSAATPSRAYRVLVLPARAGRDLIAALMLARVLRLERFDVRLATSRGEARAAFGRWREEAADLVVVSATPPTALADADSICRQIKSVAPEQKIVVGFWRGTDDEAEPADEAGKLQGVEAIVTSIGAAVALCEGCADGEASIDLRPSAEAEMDAPA